MQYFHVANSSLCLTANAFAIRTYWRAIRLQHASAMLPVQRQWALQRMCVCVRGGRTCTSCTTSRSGRCANISTVETGRARSTTELEPPARPTQQLELHAINGTSSTNTEKGLLPSNESIEPECLPGTAAPQDTCRSNQNEDSSQFHPLPSFTALTAPNFQWGEKDGEYLIQIVDRCYDTVVHWRRNLFKIPSGKVGVAFVHELSLLFQAYAESSALEGVALKAAMILPALLLQKPHARSRTKEHTKHLKRRLNLWKDGDLVSLLDEGQTIQSRLAREYSGRSSLSDQLTRKFSKLMMEGKVRAALRLIADNNTGQPLHLNSQIDFKLTRKELETSC